MNMSSRVHEILDRAVAWDNHACLPMRPDEEFLPQLERCRKAGFTVVSVNVGFGDMSPEQHLRLLATFRRWLKQRPESYVLARRAEDVRVAKQTGRLAVFFDIEGAGAVSDQLGLVELYYDLGVRWMLLVYNSQSLAGGGCHGEDGGLTAYGRALIREMERVGMLACCSHAGRRTALEIMEHSRQPVIFSHSNPRALWDHERNIDDDLLDACAASGGVIGINGIGIFLGENDASSETFVRHVDHAVQRVGPKHVGIGLDYVFDRRELDDYVTNNPDLFPPEKGYSAGIRMVEPEQLPQIVEELLRLGYADTDILDVLGGNFLRLAKEVWKAPSGR